MPQSCKHWSILFGANSITLTPGTVSVDVQDDHILVHALLSEMADPDDFADMSERSAWAVGEEIDAPRRPSEESVAVTEKSGETS